MANGTITSAQLRELAEQHITTEVSRYRGKIWQWDVVNEFFTDANPSGIGSTNWWIVNAGPDIIPNAFKWAHAADPGALLFLNDYNIAGEDGTNAKNAPAKRLGRPRRSRGERRRRSGGPGR